MQTNKIKETVLENGVIKIEEQHDQTNRFNIMPGRFVEETLHVKSYEIDLNNHEVTATFDRSYMSEMRDSPDHLIMTSLPLHGQKIAYMYVNALFGNNYDPTAPEFCKVWPTGVDIKMPKLIPENKNLTHTMKVKKFIKMTEAMTKQCPMIDFTKYDGYLTYSEHVFGSAIMYASALVIAPKNAKPVVDFLK